MKTKKTSSYLLLMLFFLFLWTSCGSVQVLKTGGQTFKSRTITIRGIDDTSGTLGQLTYLLYERHFKILSYATVKGDVQLHETTSLRDTATVDRDAQICVSQKYQSYYILELDYAYAWNCLSHGYRYNSFSARLVNMQSGKVVMSAFFRGNRSVKHVLKEFANKLDDEL